MTCTTNKSGLATLPTTTATPARLCVFQATRRPTQQTRTFRSESFGSVTVEGKLGQVHADLVECVTFFAETWRIKDGRLEIVVDPYKVRSAMSGTSEVYPASTISELQKDLRKALLDIQTPKHKVMGGIVERIVQSKMVKIDRRGWGDGGKERRMECWVFTLEWTALVESDIPPFYDPRPLCRLERGSVAAIARHVLTHHHQPRGGWKLDGLMVAAGVTRQPSKVKKEIEESANRLAELGIQIDGDRVFLATKATSLATKATFEDEFSHKGHIF